jgi:hypothetical protein
MLTMTSTGTDQKAYQMTMSKGDSRYEVSPKRLLFAEKGTELNSSPSDACPKRLLRRYDSPLACVSSAAVNTRLAPRYRDRHAFKRAPGHIPDRHDYAAQRRRTPEGRPRAPARGEVCNTE